MSMSLRRTQFEESLPQNIRDRARWPVCSATTGAWLGSIIFNVHATRFDTLYLPVMPDGKIVPGFYDARSAAALALYAHSEGAQ